MGYRHWPPDPSEPPRHDSDPRTTGGYQHGGWSAPHSEYESGSHRQDDHGAWPTSSDQGEDPRYPGYGGYGAGYGGHGTGPGYGTDPDATYVYPAVPPTTPRRTPRRPVPDEPPADDVVDDPTWMPALAWTAGFFVVPVLLYVLWAATRAGEAAPGCIDSSGLPCDSPRAEALAGLASILPSLAGALTLALLATLALRRIAVNWRPSTVAFAASIIGAGTATLIASLLG